MSDVVLYEVRDRTAVITFNRPERLNAWTADLGEGYWNGLDRAAADDNVVCIVITGAGRGYCAGADMDLLQGIGAGERQAPARAELQSYARAIPKPIVAAINGACAGMGMSQALMCDVRFAAAGAKFTTAFARRGLVAEHGMSWALPLLVGSANALEIMFSGRVFTAEEAQQMGLVNKVVPPDELLDFTLAWCADVAANCAPSSLAAMKHQVWFNEKRDLSSAYDEANRLMNISTREFDFKEGVASFVQRRPPNFRPIQGWTKS